MKYTRYLMIGLLWCMLGTFLWNYLAPIVVSGPENSVNAELRASAISHYRSILLPWIASVGLILVGWHFSRQRTIAYGAMVLAIVALIYAVAGDLRSVGYTFNQSLSALLQGHGSALGGSLVIWSSICLVAILALPFFVGTKLRGYPNKTLG